MALSVLPADLLFRWWDAFIVYCIYSIYIYVEGMWRKRERTVFSVGLKGELFSRILVDLFRAGL